MHKENGKDLQKDRMNVKKEEVRFVQKEQLKKMGIQLFTDDEGTNKTNKRLKRRNK